MYLFKIFVFFSFPWIVFLLLGQVFSLSCFFVLFSRSVLFCSQVPRCSGFCCRAWVLAHRLSSCGCGPACSSACRIFSDQGLTLCLLHCLYHWATREALLLFFFMSFELRKGLGSWWKSFADLLVGLHRHFFSMGSLIGRLIPEWALCICRFPAACCCCC